MLPGYRGREAASCNRDQPASTKCEYTSIQCLHIFSHWYRVDTWYKKRKEEEKYSGNIDWNGFFNVKLLLFRSILIIRSTNFYLTKFLLTKRREKCITLWVRIKIFARKSNLCELFRSRILIECNYAWFVFVRFTDKLFLKIVKLWDVLSSCETYYKMNHSNMQIERYFSVKIPLFFPCIINFIYIYFTKINLIIYSEQLRCSLLPMSIMHPFA